jgi:hypothetical protein
MFKALVVAFNAVSAGQTSPTYGDSAYKLNDLRRTEVLIEVIALPVGDADPSTVVFTLQPQQSLDGQIWYPIDDPITTAGLSTFYVMTPYFNLVLSPVQNGAVTVRLA